MLCSQICMTMALDYTCKGIRLQWMSFPSGGHTDNTPDKKFCCAARLGFIQSLQWILKGYAQVYLRLLPPAFFSPPSSLTFLSTSCSFLARNPMDPFALPTWFCFSSFPDQHQMSFRLQLTFCVCTEISYTPIFFSHLKEFLMLMTNVSGFLF